MSKSIVESQEAVKLSSDVTETSNQRLITSDKSSSYARQSENNKNLSIYTVTKQQYETHKQFLLVGMIVLYFKSPTIGVDTYTDFAVSLCSALIYL